MKVKEIVQKNKDEIKFFEVYEYISNITMIYDSQRDFWKILKDCGECEVISTTIEESDNYKNLIINIEDNVVAIFYEEFAHIDELKCK